MAEGWTPEPADLVAEGSLRANDSTIKRTNGHGSILARSENGFFFDLILLWVLVIGLKKVRNWRFWRIL